MFIFNRGFDSFFCYKNAFADCTSLKKVDITIEENIFDYYMELIKAEPKSTETEVVMPSSIEKELKHPYF